MISTALMVSICRAYMFIVSLRGLWVASEGSQGKLVTKNAARFDKMQVRIVMIKASCSNL